MTKTVNPRPSMIREDHCHFGEDAAPGGVLWRRSRQLDGLKGDESNFPLLVP